MQGIALRASRALHPTRSGRLLCRKENRLFHESGERAYPAPAIRAVAGFLAAAVSVVTFHAAAWWVLHQFGLMPAPYPMRPTAPFGLPLIASLTFWGALYGIPFGLAWPHMGKAAVLWGFGLGFIACLVGWFVVAPLKGAPPVGGSIIIPIVVNGAWGVGVAVLTPLLLSGMRQRSTPATS